MKAKLNEKIEEQRQSQIRLQKAELKIKEKKLLLTEKEKELLSEKLSSSERALILKAMMRKEFVNLLNDLKSKLKVLDLNEGLGSKKALNSVYYMINNFEKSEQTDKEFMMHFDNIHPQFYVRLNKRHPNLNLNDQKLCAYIKMNMSTKEIARLLNIHPPSVNTARYRLRMKLNLSKDDDLNNYIQRI